MLFEILIKKALDIYSYLDKYFDPYYVLMSPFFGSKLLDLLFEMLPENYDIYKLKESINISLENDLTSREYYYLIHESLKYAIRLKSKYLFDFLEHLW